MNSYSFRETILVVDDSASLREIIELLLVRVGYCVITASNGTDALRIACDTPDIDMLLSGVDLSGMRGDELATHFSALHPSAAIILLSDSIHKIETEAPFDLLPLPFTVAELRGKINSAFKATPAFAESSLVAIL